KNRSLGDAEQLRTCRHVEAAEKPGLDYQRLARLKAGKLLEGGIEAQQLVRAARRLIGRVVQRHDPQSSAPLLSVPSAGGLDQDLAHRARGNPCKVQVRDPSKPRRVPELEPGLVHKRCGTERRVRIAAPYTGGQAPQLLICHAEQVVQGAPIAQQGFELSAL